MLAFDTEKARSYRAEDLDRLLRFVGQCNRALSDYALPHPGDVVYLMSNVLRGRDLDRHIFLYEELDGRLRAVVLLYPGARWHYGLLLDPALRTSGDDAFEAATLAWAEDATRAASQRDAGGEIGVDVTLGDTVRETLLKRLGYTTNGVADQLYATRSLGDSIPEKPLPEGFSIRPVAGEHEAELAAEVHNGAFTPIWDAESYRAVMRTPGFQIDHELVVVAPDGRFAAYVCIWLDPISRSGSFAPVGCHRDFQRLGLTSALMYEGMRRMRAAGMETAIVRYDADNSAGVPFYRSVGFQTLYQLAEYRKRMPPRS